MTEIEKQSPLWTGSFVKICLVNLFIFINFHALLPTFPFFVTYLGGDAVAIGLATALFSIASIVSRPFVGWLIDTKGRCAILLLGLIGMTLIPMGYFVSAGIALAVILRTIHGVFHAASSNASSTWVTDIIPRTRMGEGLGMYGLSMAVSTAVAPALGLAVMNYWGFRPLFAITALVALVALLIGLSIYPRNYKLSEKPFKFRELFEPMSFPAAVTQFFFMMAYGVIEVYVAIYAAENDLPGGGIYFVGIAVSTVLTRILLGRAVDKYGEARLVYGGNAAIIAGILLLVYAHNVPCYLLSAILLGFSFGAIQPSLQTMAMHAVAPERRGAASSTFFVAFDLGIALGGFLAGLLIKYLGYDYMFCTMILACVISLAYYYVFGRNHASSFNPHTRMEHSVANMETSTTEMPILPLVVTISREYGSGGHRIGELLAQRLGVKLYDKELISLTANKSGLSENTVQDSEQKVDGIILYDDPVQTSIFRSQSRIIRDIAAHESCVIVGRLANFVLKNRENCINLFIYADESYRAKRISTALGIDTEVAMSRMKQSDQDRKDHCQHYTGCEWGNRRYYNLMIDRSLSDDNAMADMIYAIISKPSEKNVGN